MEITETTRLKEILDAYPWLPEVLIGMDSRFSVINNPVGKLLIRSATLGDACKKAGFSADQALAELKKLIAEHEKN